MTRARLMLVLTAIAVLASGMVFVWPTPYRDIAIRSPGPRVLAARQHRVTGRVELLSPSGWRSLTPASPRPSSGPSLDSMARHYGVDTP